MPYVRECFEQSLIEAVKEDDVDLVKMLLSKGAPTDAIDEVGLQVLQYLIHLFNQAILHVNCALQQVGSFCFEGPNLKIF